MHNSNKFKISLNNFLFILITLVPISFVLRSLTININVILISVITICIILKEDFSKFFKDKFILYIFAFFLFILINSLINYNGIEIVLKSIGNFRYLLLSAAVFYVLQNAAKEQKKFLIYFNVILIIFISADIFYQYFTYKNIFSFPPGMCNQSVSPMVCQRFSGVFKDELIGGGYLSQIGLLFFLLFYFIDEKKNSILNKNYILFLGLFITIILSGERNAALIFILTILISLFFQKKLLKIFLSILLFILLLFSLGNFSNEVDKRFVKPIKSINYLNFSKFFKQVRNSHWGHHYEASIELFFEKPIFGHGPKSFRIVCNKTKIQKNLIEEDKKYRACATNPHNYFLEFLSENGIVGGFFYLGFIFIIIYQILKINKKKDTQIFIIIALGSLLLAILFPIKPSGSFFSTFNATILFYLIGFYLHYLKKIR